MTTQPTLLPFRKILKDLDPNDYASVRYLTKLPPKMPSVAEGTGHLLLLRALGKLYEDTTRGIPGELDRNKQWQVYVTNAVRRFIIFLSAYKALRPTDLGDKLQIYQFKNGKRLVSTLGKLLPPLDVIMVWHSFMLNPKSFFDDCARNELTDFAYYPFPLKKVITAIDPDTFEFTPTADDIKEFDTLISSYDAKLNLSYKPRLVDILNMDLTVYCPLCHAIINTVKYTNIEGTGFADKDFRIYGPLKCKCAVQLQVYFTSHDTLRTLQLYSDAINLDNNKILPCIHKYFSGVLHPELFDKDKVNGVSAACKHLIRSLGVWDGNVDVIKTLVLQFCTVPKFARILKNILRNYLQMNLIHSTIPIRGVSRNRSLSGGDGSIHGGSVRRGMSPVTSSFNIHTPKSSNSSFDFGNKNDFPPSNSSFTSNAGGNNELSRTSSTKSETLGEGGECVVEISEDLVGCVLRQQRFVEKMNKIDHLHSPMLKEGLRESCIRYDRYFQLMTTGKKNSLVVPTLDIDLMWHTHQLGFYYYLKKCVESKAGMICDHNDKIEEGRLALNFERTAKLYKEKFKEEYCICFCWFCVQARKRSNRSKVFVKKKSEQQSVKDMSKSWLFNWDNETGVTHISAHNYITWPGTRGIKNRERLYVNYPKKTNDQFPWRDDPYYRSTYNGMFVISPIQPIGEGASEFWGPGACVSTAPEGNGGGCGGSGCGSATCGNNGPGSGAPCGGAIGACGSSNSTNYGTGNCTNGTSANCSSCSGGCGS